MSKRGVKKERPIKKERGSVAAALTKEFATPAFKKDLQLLQGIMGIVGLAVKTSADFSINDTPVNTTIDVDYEEVK
jgi:hypothetical protein